VTVAAESGCSGCGRARSVRTVSASNERVEPVVLVPGWAVTAAQAPDLVRGDHQHGQTGRQQRVDDRPVRTLDADLDDAGAAQALDQASQTGRGVLDTEPLELDAALRVDDRDRVILAGPVDTCSRPASRPIPRRGDGSTPADVLGDTHYVSMLWAQQVSTRWSGTRQPVAH